MRENKFTEYLLAFVAIEIMILFVIFCIGFDRAVTRIEKAINQYATPNSDGSPR